MHLVPNKSLLLTSKAETSLKYPSSLQETFLSIWSFIFAVFFHVQEKIICRVCFYALFGEKAKIKSFLCGKAFPFSLIKALQMVFMRSVNNHRGWFLVRWVWKTRYHTLDSDKFRKNAWSLPQGTREKAFVLISTRNQIGSNYD